MRVFFNNVSLDGCFVDLNGDMSWAHKNDAEWNVFTAENASGSGTIISQLAQEGLIDEYQIVVNPIVLGKGRTMFESVKDKPVLRLTKTRIFGNGNVFLCYEPRGK